METSRAELEGLRQLARELVNRLDALITVEREAERAAEKFGAPAARTRIP